MERIQSRNGPQLTWTNIIATLGFGTLLMASFMGAFWTVFQTQFSNSERRIERVEKDLHSIPTKDEHQEFKARIDGTIVVIQKQLDRIETTKPSVDTLRLLGDNSASQASKLEERVRSVEDYLRTIRPLAPVTPAPGH
jgi:hypothetical protein